MHWEQQAIAFTNGKAHYCHAAHMLLAELYDALQQLGSTERKPFASLRLGRNVTVKNYNFFVPEKNYTQMTRVIWSNTRIWSKENLSAWRALYWILSVGCCIYYSSFEGLNKRKLPVLRGPQKSTGISNGLLQNLLVGVPCPHCSVLRCCLFLVSENTGNQGDTLQAHSLLQSHLLFGSTDSCCEWHTSQSHCPHINSGVHLWCWLWLSPQLAPHLCIRFSIKVKQRPKEPGETLFGHSNTLPHYILFNYYVCNFE